MLPVVPENASPQTPQAPALPPVPPPPAREGGGGRKESPSNGKGKHNGSPTSAESSKHHFHLELPAVIKDPNTGKSYHRGRLLGKVSSRTKQKIMSYSYRISENFILMQDDWVPNSPSPQTFLYRKALVIALLRILRSSI